MASPGWRCQLWNVRLSQSESGRWWGGPSAPWAVQTQSLRTWVDWLEVIATMAFSNPRQRIVIIDTNHMEVGELERRSEACRSRPKSQNSTNEEQMMTTGFNVFVFVLTIIILPPGGLRTILYCPYKAVIGCQLRELQYWGNFWNQNERTIDNVVCRFVLGICWADLR